ncbi:hypothetical protein TrVE_jg1395 [Triparma verrucosa]|uniref:Uncharacterized protein n=1 Tax=Triparma verrucosa TaxID=1606542 RepID=A0A9W7FPV0_9STRA|nr:hypothetical protein TrVE_jg1395 [Triparma verrucosa]
MKEAVEKSKEEEVQVLKQRLEEAVKKVEALAKEKEGEVEREAKEMEFKLQDAKLEEEIVVGEEEEEGEGGEGAIDQLVKGSHTPEDAKTLLKDLGERCGWGTSPDGFALDFELARAIHSLRVAMMQCEDKLDEDDIDDDEADELEEKSAAYNAKYLEVEEHHKEQVLPTASLLVKALERMEVKALERMEGWDTEAGRELAEKNANELLEKNEDVKTKRKVYTDSDAKLQAAKKDPDFDREEKKQLRNQTKELKKIAYEAELAVGIFRPDEGKEGKAARMRDMNVIRAILVSAEAGEKDVEKLDGTRPSLASR